MTEQEKKVIQVAIETAARMEKEAWYAGHEFERIKEAVKAYVDSMPTPVELGDVPYPVKWAIVKRFAGNLPQARDVLRRLRKDHFGGYFHFEWAGMYVGVENDGYMHT